MDPQHWYLLTCGGGPEDGLIPGEEGAQGEVRLPGDEVGGGLAHHPAGEEGRHLQGQGGAQRGGGVSPRSFTSYKHIGER
jgi:hypothetical protein